MRNAPLIGLAALALTSCAPEKPAGQNFTCLETSACANVARMPLREAMRKIDIGQPNHRMCNVTLGDRIIGQVGIGPFAIPTGEDPVRGHCGTSISSHTFSHAPVLPVTDQQKACQKEEIAASILGERLADQLNIDPKSEKTKALVALVMMARNALAACQQQQPLRRDYQGT